MYKIAIVGKANSGKNTLSKILSKKFKRIDPCLKIKYLAFADPLKKMVKLMFPYLPNKFLVGPSKFRSEPIPNAFKGPNPLTVRQVLLDLGTEVGRGYKDDLWIDSLNFRLSKIKNNCLVIVTDVRFINEFKFLKDNGFFMIKLVRGETAINHVSELEQDKIPDSDFDYICYNKSNLSNLILEVEKIIKLVLNH